jgi:hypothetical protein
MAQLPDFQPIKNAHEAQKRLFSTSGKPFFNVAITKKAKNFRTKNRSKILTVKNFASNLLF